MIHLLAQRTLPSYLGMSIWLKDMAFMTWLGNLWEKIFDEKMPKFVDAYDAGGYFVGRVETELFPLDTRGMDNDYGNGCRPHEIFGWYIPIYGYGIAWECEPLCDQPEWAKPMVAAVGIMGHSNSMHNNLTTTHEQGWSYFSDHNVELEDLAMKLDWVTDYHRAIDLLGDLEEPLDALATVYKMTTRASENAFLDSVDLFWRFDYPEADYCWCEHCIKELTRQWNDAESEIGYLNNFINAFGFGITTETIINTLVNLDVDAEE